MQQRKILDLEIAHTLALTPVISMFDAASVEPEPEPVNEITQPAPASDATPTTAPETESPESVVSNPDGTESDQAETVPATSSSDNTEQPVSAPMSEPVTNQVAEPVSTLNVDTTQAEPVEMQINVLEVVEPVTDVEITIDEAPEAVFKTAPENSGQGASNTENTGFSEASIKTVVLPAHMLPSEPFLYGSNMSGQIINTSAEALLPTTPSSNGNGFSPVPITLDHSIFNSGSYFTLDDAITSLDTPTNSDMDMIVTQVISDDPDTTYSGPQLASDPDYIFDDSLFDLVPPMGLVPISVMTDGSAARINKTMVAQGASEDADVVIAEVNIEPVVLTVINNDGTRPIDEIVAGELAAGREVLIIESGEDGVAKINAYFDDQPETKDYDSMVIYSHGINNQIILGDVTITSENVSISGVEDWSEHLAAGADIVFASCNAAEGDDGKVMIDQIAELTGADVGASTDATGNSENGDWDLEYQAGDGEITTDFADEVIENYTGADFDNVLATWQFDHPDGTVHEYKFILHTGSAFQSWQAAENDAHAFSTVDSSDWYLATFTTQAEYNVYLAMIDGTNESAIDQANWSGAWFGAVSNPDGTNNYYWGDDQSPEFNQNISDNNQNWDPSDSSRAGSTLSGTGTGGNDYGAVILNDVRNTGTGGQEAAAPGDEGTWHTAPLDGAHSDSFPGPGVYAANAYIIETSIPNPEPPIIDPEPNTNNTDDGCLLFYTEGDAASSIAPNLSIGDNDSANMTRLNVVFTSNWESTDVISINQSSLPSGVTTTVTTAANGTPTGINIIGSATIAQYEAIAQSITYESTSQNPGEALRNVSWQVFDDTSDGALPSNTGTSQVCVDAVADPPVITPPTPVIPGDPTDPNDPGCTIVYTENDPATTFASDISFSDIDSDNLTGATVVFSGIGWEATDIISFDNAIVPAGVIVSVATDAGGVPTGITITGETTVGEYEAIAQSFAYESTSENPNENERLLTWTIFDDTADENNFDHENSLEEGPLPSNIITTAICVDAVADPPVITPPTPVIPGDPTDPNDPGCTIVYTENDPATTFASDISFSDIDSDNLTGATVVFSGIGWEATDIISFDNSIVPAGVIVSVVTDAGGVPTGITITGETTVGEYEAIAQSFAYESTSENPNENVRLLTWTIFDDTAYENNFDHENSLEEGPLPSNIITTAICVDAVADPPVIDNPYPIDPNDPTYPNDPNCDCDVVYVENGDAVALMPLIDFSDIDSENLTSATIDFSGDGWEPTDIIKFNTPAGIMVTLNTASDGVPTGISIIGEASLEQYEAIAQSITYESSSERPSEADRIITVQIFDDTPDEDNFGHEASLEEGPLESNIININLCVDAVPDPPVIELNPNNLPCTPITSDQPHVLLFPNATISDIDSDNLTRMRLEFDLGVGDRIRFDEDLVPDDVSYTADFNDNGDYVVNFTGTASVEEYETLLQSFGGRNTGEGAPGSHQLGVSVSVFDDTPDEENGCYETNPENGSMGTAELGALRDADAYCASVFVPSPPPAQTDPDVPLRHIAVEEYYPLLIDEDQPDKEPETHIFIHALVNGFDHILESQYDNQFVNDQVLQNTLKEGGQIIDGIDSALDHLNVVNINSGQLADEMELPDHQVIQALSDAMRLEHAIAI